MSTVITAVHCGPAEGAWPVRVHQVTLDGGIVTQAVARTCKQGKRQDKSLKKGAVYPRTRKQMKLICSMKGLDYDLEEMTVISYQCHRLRHHAFALDAEK